MQNTECDDIISTNCFVYNICYVHNIVQNAVKEKDISDRVGHWKT